MRTVPGCAQNTSITVSEKPLPLCCCRYIYALLSALQQAFAITVLHAKFGHICMVMVMVNCNRYHTGQTVCHRCFSRMQERNISVFCRGRAARAAGPCPYGGDGPNNVQHPRSKHKHLMQ